MPWNAKNSGPYVLGSTEANENAVMIHDLLSSWGYGYNSICAILGNIGYESGYNPFRWQGDVILFNYQNNLIDNQTGHAYGLLQFDPAGQYIHNTAAQSYADYSPNFANQPGFPKDGAGQLQYMNYIAIPINGAHIPTQDYPLTFAQFKQSTANVDYLTNAWLYNYERGTPANDRLVHARYWYEHLSELIGGTHRMKWIYYLRRRR